MLRVLCVVTLVVAAMAVDNSKPYYDVDDAPNIFEKYIQDYQKVYKDEEDRKIHYDAFVNSLKQINKANEENSATFDINQYSDFTNEEFQQVLGFHPGKKEKKDKKKNKKSKPKN